MSGEILSMSRGDYDRVARVNWSTLKAMRRSPQHYRHALMEKHVDTDAMCLGRVTHLATFEPERWSSDVAVWDGRRAGKEWEAFVKANKGREIIKEDPAQLARQIGAAVRADAIAAPYLAKGRSEVTLMWTHQNGLEARGRVDFLTDEGIVDLKTCRDASPEVFGRQCASLLYHAQAAYYVDGLAAITGKRMPYFVVAVETKEPFAVCVYQITEDLLGAGETIYKPLLDRLKICRDTNHWPSYSEGIEKLQLPHWALPNDEDYDGLGLTGFGGADGQA